jgi:hypothetical protein
MGFLAILGMFVALTAAAMKMDAAEDDIDAMIEDLDSAIAGLNEQIEAVETDRTREIAQADALLEAEKTRIAAEKLEVTIDESDAYTSRVEQELADLLEKHEIDQDEYDRRKAAVEENRAAEREKIELAKKQALESKDQSLGQLTKRAEEGDVESARKVSQITAKRDQFLAQTKDEAILTLNRAGQQAEYEVGVPKEEASLKAGEARAGLAATAVRATGSPLLALRQVEKAARAEQQEAERQARYTVQATAMGYAQEVGSARTEAEQSVEDVMAANALADKELERTREDTELAFRQTYENLEASTADVERQAKQETAELAYQEKTEDTQYKQEAARIKNEARLAAEQLDRDLNTAILQTDQAKEDIQDQADILTQQYRRSLADAARHKTNLVTNRSSIVAAAGVGAVSSILTAASGFIDTLPASQAVV